jgi:hypothetical protein
MVNNYSVTCRHAERSEASISPLAPSLDMDVSASLQHDGGGWLMPYFFRHAEQSEVSISPLAPSLDMDVSASLQHDERKFLPPLTTNN